MLEFLLETQFLLRSVRALGDTFFFRFLTEWQNATFFSHGDVTFKNGAVADDKALRRNIADYRTGRLNIEFLFGLDIRPDFALDQDGCCCDFPFYGCLLSNCNVGLAGYFALDIALD